MRRPVPYLVGAAGADARARAAGASASPHRRRQPRRAAHHRVHASGCTLLETTLGPGALAPHQIVVDTHRPGGALRPGRRRGRAPPGRRAARATPRSRPAPSRRRSDPAARDSPRSARPSRRAGATSSTRTGSVVQIRAAGTSDSGTQRPWTSSTASATATSRGALPGRRRRAAHRRARLRRRLRRHAPTAPSPGSCSPCSSLSYLLLLRAFRSVVLPLKAVLMNLLSVSATYGVLVLAFQHGWGEPCSASSSSAQIEAWIPIFLFAMLFGLSMDYEVFLLSRMREEWDRTPRQRARGRLRARAHRPDHHGRRDHHDRRVLGLHRRQLRRPAGVRARPLGGDPARRDGRARAPRAGH